VLTLTKSDLALLKQGIIPPYFKDKSKDELVLFLVDKLLDCDKSVREAYNIVEGVRYKIDHWEGSVSEHVEKLEMAENTLMEVEAL